MMSICDPLSARYEHHFRPYPPSAGPHSGAHRTRRRNGGLHCIIVAAELRFGAAKKQSARLTAQLEAILAVIEIIPLDVPADSFYGQIRARLEQTGEIIGGNDLLIASHAMALGHTLVSDNEREFGRVKGLVYENWLRD